MKSYYPRLDLLRGIAAFGIIGCHLNLAAYTPAVRTLLSYCDLNVGVFGAIAGYLMAAQDDLLRDQKINFIFIQKRVLRLLPVYIIWTMIYCLFRFVVSIMMHKEISFDWFNVVFLGGGACHLWFLVALFYAQVLFVFLLFGASFLKVENRFFLVTGLVILVASAYWSSIIPYGSSFWSWFSYYFLRLFAYLLIGYGIFGWGSRFNHMHEWAIFSILLASVMLRPMFPFHKFIKDLLIVIPLLLVCCREKTVPWPAQNIIRLLARTSLGVYLVHPIVCAIGTLLLNKIYSSPFTLITTLAYWSCIWGISLLIAYIGLKTPGVNRVLN